MITWAVILIISYPAYVQHPIIKTLYDGLADRVACDVIAEAINEQHQVGKTAVCVAHVVAR